MDKLSELGTARGFAEQRVERAQRELVEALTERNSAAANYQQYAAECGQIDDGFGGVWQLCKPGCQLQIVRPGKVQCDCD